MTYQIYDNKGCVADIATGSGLWGLIQYLEKQNDPDIKTLAKELAIPLTPAVIKKIKALPAPADESTRSILTDLKSLVDTCEGILIFGDGIIKEGL